MNLSAQCMGYLGATLTQVFTRVRGQSGRVTQRCHNSSDGKRGYRVRVTSRTGSVEDFERFWKSQWVELSPASGEDGWLSLARRSQARWKSQDRKNVYLSPYVEKPLNSKVIKCFVPELRSRKCFSCFEIPMFYVLCIYVTNIMNILMYVSHIHLWVCYIWGVNTWVYGRFFFIGFLLYHLQKNKTVPPQKEASLALTLSCIL